MIILKQIMGNTKVSESGQCSNLQSINHFTDGTTVEYSDVGL